MLITIEVSTTTKERGGKRKAKKVEEEEVGLVSVREGATNLQNSLGQSRLLCQLLEVFGVGVVVEGEVGLHGPQLVMLEARVTTSSPVAS